ncbi:sodium:solute symporter family transporter [Parvularcula lutaonensis]|uniref:Sodium:solute symporter n=1 Tax=Parvularcula lutaonensis TaxID=491923 RepID=A0ABV7ME80_9PROT|nr:hypothetical protein [Parvularcula lutaonensis]GGY50986.1 hypothetical protein GCM10007148_19780 [Parvularcula lutaonensis]
MTALFLGLYVLLQVGIAAWAARGTKTDTDYLVAGRTLGVWQIAFSIFATWFAAETVIATSAEVASDGLAGARVEPFGYAFGLVALGTFIAYRLRQEGHMTLASFLGSRFGPQVEIAAACFTALSATVWAAAQLSALAIILSEATGLGVPLMLVASMAIVLVYAWVGGLKGDVITDVLQGAVIILVLLVLLFLVIDFAGGLGAAVAAIPEGALSMRKEGESWLERIELWSLPILGTIVSQEVIARTLGAKSPETARRGTFLGAGIYLAIGMVPVLLGLVGPGLGLGLDGGDGYFTSLARTILPAWLYVIISGAMISAILSSVDSALLAVSAVATENGLVKLRPRSNGRQRLAMARFATAAAAVSAMAIAAAGDSIRAIVLTGEGIAGLLVLPVVVGLLVPGTGRVPVLAALLVSLALTAWLDWISGTPGAFLFALAGGAMAFVLTRLVLMQTSRFAGSPGSQEAP